MANYETDIIGLPNRLMELSLLAAKKAGHLDCVYLRPRPTNHSPETQPLDTFLRQYLMAHGEDDPYCPMLEKYWSQLLQSLTPTLEIMTRTLPLFVPNYTACLPSDTLPAMWNEKVRLTEGLVLYKVGISNGVDRGLQTGLTLIGDDFYACTPPIISPDATEKVAFITRRVLFESDTGEGKQLARYWNNRNLPNR